MNNLYGNINQTIGQFILWEQDNEEYILTLMDKEGRQFAMSQVCVLSAKNSDDSTEINIPQPFIYDKNKKLVRRGANVLITFPKGNSTPIVLGAINSLGMQDKKNGYERIDKNNLDAITSNISHKDCLIRRIEDSKGYELMIQGGAYKVQSDYNIIISSDGANIVDNTEINIETKSLNLFGVNPDIIDKNGDIDHNLQASDEINLFSKKINLGYLPSLYEEPLKLDNDKEVDNPKYQNSVMGITLKALISTLIDILKNSIYMGNGVSVTMSTQDKNRLENEVKKKLPKILSQIVYNIYNQEVTK